MFEQAANYGQYGIYFKSRVNIIWAYQIEY